MKAKLIFLGISILFLCQMNFVYADYDGDDQSSWQDEPSEQQGNGFKVKISNPDGSFVFGQNGPNFEPNRKHHRRRSEIRWLDILPGTPIPPIAVVGGTENYRPLYICHATYNGVHPGKVVGRNCNIGYAGREISVPEFQVLISRAPLNWIPGNNGYIPPRAIVGGFENGRPLYICQTQYLGGTHPGKIVGRNCNISYGGKEIAIPFYNVLVN